MEIPERFPITILYVDDEDMARKYFARMVGAEFDVMTSPGVNDALDVLQKERIGVLVTDYRMQEKDGGDLLREVARDYPHIVCILVTAYADKNLLLETVNSAEVFRILEKPLDSTQVRNVLRLATNLARDRATHRQGLLAINETLAFLSHELNTPLATIVNFSRAIRRLLKENGTLAPPFHDIDIATNAMHDNARYCLKVLSTLSASAQSADNLMATINDCLASQLITSLIDTFPLSPTQRTFIRVDLVDDFRIRTMPNIVSLVLSSVLSNALRAMNEQVTPELRILVIVEDTPQIRFIDNGSGIAPELLVRLLIDPVTTHSHSGGSGWGLILSNRIMQAFGGGISVNSELGQGTTVTLTFPATKN